jgi:PASTA domain-containing protein
MARRPPPPEDYPAPPGEYEGPPPAREYGVVRGGPPPPPWWREMPWVWVALFAILVAAGVLIAIVAFRNSSNSSSTTTVTVTSGSTVTTTATATTTVTTQPKLVKVPSVSGQTQINAIDSAQSAGLVPNSYPVSSRQQRGTVVAQSPAGGGQVTQGSAVRLNVSSGTGQRPTVSIPDVTGPQAGNARMTLARAKLCVRTLTRTAPSSNQAGDVVAQSPSAGTSVQQYAQVTIYVGT